MSIRGIFRPLFGMPSELIWTNTHAAKVVWFEFTWSQRYWYKGHKTIQLHWRLRLRSRAVDSFRTCPAAKSNRLISNYAILISKPAIFSAGCVSEITIRCYQGSLIGYGRTSSTKSQLERKLHKFRGFDDVSRAFTVLHPCLLCWMLQDIFLLSVVCFSYIWLNTISPEEHNRFRGRCHWSSMCIRYPSVHSAP